MLRYAGYQLVGFCHLQPYIVGWNPWGAEALNPYQALMVDSMHQADLGIFTHVRECIEMLFKDEKRKELDDRLSAVKQTMRFGELTSKLPEQPYFQSAASIPAFEHEAAFQVILASSDGKARH